MARPTCVFHFHCGGAASSKEHVFPAALGGRRKDSRILCEACQARFSQLDEVLPEQLRLFNTRLGVVGDHRARPARTTVREPTSGQEFLLGHDGEVNVPTPVRAETHVAPDGSERRHYQFLGETGEREFLDKLRKSGAKIEVFERTVEPLLLAGPLQVDLKLGGPDGLRAAARVALNFLAVHFPAQARAPGLEPFKKWLLGIEGDSRIKYGSFGAPLPEGGLPPPTVEHAHRVVLAFDGHSAFARVIFFDAYEVAFALGNVEEGMGATVRAFDIDPLSKALRRSPDVHPLPADSVTVVPADVGRMMSDEAHADAIYARAGDRLSGIIAKALEQEWDRRLALIIADLRAAAELEATPRHSAVVKLLLKHCPQHAANLVLEVIRRLATYLEQKGAPPYLVSAVTHLTRPGKKSGAIQRPVDALVQLMLNELRAELAATPAIEKIALRALLDGESGLRLALKVVIFAVREVPGMAPFLDPPASS